MNLSHVKLMGILNMTPDSFWDGGNLNVQNIENAANLMIKSGATILDIGGESTGPNSQNVSLDEEIARVIPALKAIMPLAVMNKVQISIDTYKSQVAENCLSLGAHIINDITGLRGDPQMATVVAAHNAKIVIMYSKDSTPRTTSDKVDYTDVIETIKRFFDERIEYAVAQGIPYQNIILDPGMGAFVSGNPKYSFEILDRLNELKTFDLPILVGTSRKSMHPFPLETRLIPSIATALQAAFNGADILRIHDVLEHALAIKTFQN